MAMLLNILQEHDLMSGESLLNAEADVESESRTIDRCKSVSVYHEKRFEIEKPDFSRQYSQVYFLRLTKLRKCILEQNVSTNIKVCQTSQDLQIDTECLVVGSLYKEMKLKPCVLDEYMEDPIAALSRENQLPEQCSSYVSEDDSLLLEDEFGRIVLKGKPDALPIASLVTGVVLGVVGKLASTGVFEVQRCVYPGIPPQPAPAVARPQDDVFVLLLSGLGVGGSQHNPLLPQLLVDFISGSLGSQATRKMASRITRVLICGNTLCSRDLVDVDETKLGMSRISRKNEKSDIDEGLKNADLCLEQLCACVDVDLMPGVDDPSSFMLPQKPLHPFLFPRASRLSTLQRVSNPCSLSVDGVEFLGCSGQNLNDMAKSVTNPAPLAMAEDLLHWRCLAPTCPDTLGCFPFINSDPFVLEERPHVLFIGNQPAFGTSLLKSDAGETRIITLPAFADSGTCALLNLRTLECEPFTFASS